MFRAVSSAKHTCDTFVRKFLELTQSMCKYAQIFDWNNLRYLLAISRHRSLSGAARELSVEHSRVSRRLAQLENSLQTRLFDRTPEGCLPTAVRETMLERAHDRSRGTGTGA
jgi:hypothetical protein